MNPKSLLTQIVAHLDRSGVPDQDFPDAGGEYRAHCPYHQDVHPFSLAVSRRGFKCLACGRQGSLTDLAERLGVRLHGCTVVGGDGAHHYTLAEYAEAKQLPVAFLRSLGLGDRKSNAIPGVRIPYRDAAGREVTAHYRIAATGDRFRWSRGARAMPYGLERLDPRLGYVHLVEGESDAQTLWFHREPALGLPDASAWQPKWAQHLAGLAVYAWQEPAEASAALVRAIGKSLPDLKVITPPAGRKDISDCHLHGDDVPALMAGLRESAQAYRTLCDRDMAAAIAEARCKAGDLPEEPHILDRFLELCRAQGLVGEERTAKLLYLALTSRLLDRPVSVAVKGPSSGGKSFTVDLALKAFPASAYYALSSMSEHSLAYSTEPLEHRVLVLYEAAGMTSDLATYLMRTLLSEGCIRYETVEKTGTGLKPRMIERAGPTGLIVTTTAAHLHPENETRLLSVTVVDTVQQTSGVLAALADRANGGGGKAVDFTPWHALQEWLALGGVHRVTIPYAQELAAGVDGRAVRLRRDFDGVLNLIRSHAILQQATRERDAQGRIVATVDDYAAVHELVIDIISEGVEASVKPEIRATVEAVKALDVPNSQPVTYKRVGEHLGIDKSAAMRRCEVALRAGYLVNRQQRRNQPAMLSVGEPLPADVPVLPGPAELGVRRPLQQPCNRATGDEEAGPDGDNDATMTRGYRQYPLLAE